MQSGCIQLLSFQFSGQSCYFRFSGQSCYFSFLGDTLNNYMLFSGHVEWLYFTVSGWSLSHWSCFPGMLSDCISQCQDGVFHTDPVFQALVSKCQLFMAWTPQTLPSGHTTCCSLPSASSLPLAQSVYLSVCLPVCPPVCQPGLNTPHPVVRQYAATCLLHYVCISTGSLSVFCLFSVILASWTDSHFGCLLLCID